MSTCLVHDPLGDNEHAHEYPDDWQWGGPDEIDPRADPRWEPTTYTYYNADVSVLWVTQVHLCDDAALDAFTLVAKIRGSNPRWCAVKRPGVPLEMLPWVYDKSTDTISPKE